MFTQHRSGWDRVIERLSMLHSTRAILLDPFIERSFDWGQDAPVQYHEPWIGFIHCPPDLPEWFHSTQGSDKLLNNPELQNNFSLCRGLFTLSKTHKTRLEKLTDIPVNSLYYPTQFIKLKWCPKAFAKNRDKKIVQLGWWLRKPNAIYELPESTYRKVFLRVLSNAYFKQLVETERKLHRQAGLFKDSMLDSVEIIDFLPNPDYDRLLSENLMFADLYDTSANTAVVECIARCTPILLNRLPALEEYLGQAYPFFYDTYDQAVQMAQDLDAVRRTHEYLCDLPMRRQLTYDAFLKDFIQSDIYQANCVKQGAQNNFAEQRITTNCLQAPEDLETIPFDELHGFIAENTVHLSGPAPENLLSGPVRLLCLLKNGEAYLPEFMSHYKKFGISDFIFLDNGSTDNTLAFLTQEPGVTVLQNNLPFKVYGLAFRQYLLERYGQGRWCLVVDVDEFFDYPFSRFLSIGQLLGYLDESGFNAVVTQMLELYSQGDVGSGDPDINFRNAHRYYDLDHIKKTPYYIDNRAGNPCIPFLQGGVRKRTFGLNKTFLTKHALIRYQGTVELKHEHYVTGAFVADISAVLYHYKFLDHFPAYVEDAVSKEYHAGDSFEYKHYQKTLEKSEPLNLFYSGSKELANTNQLICDQFLHVSDSFVRFARRCLEEDTPRLNAWSKEMAAVKKDTIQIVSTADNNYQVPLTIMLFSLLENLKKGVPIEISILSRDFSPSAQSRLHDLVDTYENATIRFFIVANAQFEKIGSRCGLAISTFFRFEIPDLFADYISRVIYLDSDMVVRKDISPLWDIDLEDRAAGAVPDRTEQIWIDYWNRCYRRLQMPPDKPYFNAGLLLMNLDVWRIQDISNTCVTFIENNPERIFFDDQDALNWVLQDNWMPLDLTYNVTTVCYQDEVEKRIAGHPVESRVKDPCIIHYTTFDKPWLLDSTHKRKQDYLDYWARYSLVRSFNLRPEGLEIAPGNCIICICHRVDYLAKAVESWLKINDVDEIVLVDPGLDPRVSPFLGTLEQTAGIVTVRIPAGQADVLTDGVLYNLALGFSRRNKILKLSCDTLLYDDFFKKTPLGPGIFFSITSWEDWGTKKAVVNDTMYAFRQDLVGVNGFHELLDGCQASFDMVHRLCMIGKQSYWINNNTFYLMGEDHPDVSGFNPLNTICLPPLDRDALGRLISLKSRWMAELAPWNYKNVPCAFTIWDANVRNAWMAQAIEPGVVSNTGADAGQIPHARIEQETFKTVAARAFPPYERICVMG